MGAIQGSINQGIATIGTIAGIGKHVKEQKVANELAKQKETTDILNQLPELETSEDELKNQIAEQKTSLGDKLFQSEIGRLGENQNVVNMLAPEIEKGEKSLQVLLAKQGAMVAQRERLEARLKDISGIDYASMREKSQAIFDKGKKDLHESALRIINEKFPNRNEPKVDDKEINATLDKLIGGDK